MDLPLSLALRDDVPPDVRPAIDALLGTIDGQRSAVVADDLLDAFGELAVEGLGTRLCESETNFGGLYVVKLDLKRACC